jgi:hypothetical protein
MGLTLFEFKEIQAKDNLIEKIVEKYSKDELLLLASRYHLNRGMPDKIAEYFYRLFDKASPYSYKPIIEVFLDDLDEMPLFINHANPDIREIARWRLTIAK